VVVRVGECTRAGNVSTVARQHARRSDGGRVSVSSNQPKRRRESTIKAPARNAGIYPRAHRDPKVRADAKRDRRRSRRVLARKRQAALGRAGVARLSSARAGHAARDVDHRARRSGGAVVIRVGDCLETLRTLADCEDTPRDQLDLFGEPNA